MFSLPEARTLLSFWSVDLGNTNKNTIFPGTSCDLGEQLEESEYFWGSHGRQHEYENNSLGMWRPVV